MGRAPIDVLAAIMIRTWKKTFRRPVSLTFSLFQPMMWMLFFGVLMQRLPLGELPRDVSYQSYLVPGICAMTVLFGASQSGIGLIRDMQTGILQRMLTTQAPRWAIHTGRVFADALRLMVQALLVGLLGLMLGAQLHFAPAQLFAGIVALLLFAVAFASLSHIVAMLTRRQEAMATFVHLVNMPLFFTSTALVPAKQMPEWLASIAVWNPLSLAVESLRATLLYQSAPGFVHQFLPLLVLAIGLTLIAIRQLGKTVSASAWEAR